MVRQSSEGQHARKLGLIRQRRKQPSAETNKTNISNRSIAENNSIAASQKYENNSIVENQVSSDRRARDSFGYAQSPY